MLLLTNKASQRMNLVGRNGFAFGRARGPDSTCIARACWWRLYRRSFLASRKNANVIEEVSNGFGQSQAAILFSAMAVGGFCDYKEPHGNKLSKAMDSQVATESSDKCLDEHIDDWGKATLVTYAPVTREPEAAQKDPPAVARPNILFIYADDHSTKSLSCYERCYTMARTPNIDALAASGMRFRAAYLGGWCMPSRASLLTGLHPHSIQSMRMEGEYPGSVYDPQICRFWPAEFRKQGYQTAQIGKWHTGTDAGWGRDWDYQIVWNRPENPENAPNYYGTQVLDFHGERRTVDGYPTDNYTQWACDYIQGQGRDTGKPWYLWLCYGAIHGPTIPARPQGLAVRSNRTATEEHLWA